MESGQSGYLNVPNRAGHCFLDLGHFQETLPLAGFLLLINPAASRHYHKRVGRLQALLAESLFLGMGFLPGNVIESFWLPRQDRADTYFDVICFLPRCWIHYLFLRKIPYNMGCGLEIAGLGRCSG